MSDIFDGIAKRARIETNVNAIRNVMDASGISIFQAMKILNIPECDYDEYIKLVTK